MQYHNTRNITHGKWKNFKKQIDALPLELWDADDVDIWGHNLIAYTRYDINRAKCENNRKARIASDAEYAERWRNNKNSPTQKYKARVKRQQNIEVATMPWADEKAIRQIYAESRAISRATGIKHEVDHIIPLVGKDENGVHVVCGLHVEANLRIITKSENLSKHCRYKE